MRVEPLETRRLLTAIFAADFSDAAGAPSLDGFTFDNSSLWHLSTGRGTQAGHSADDSMYYGSGEGAGGGGTYDGGYSTGRITSPLIVLPIGLPKLTFNYFLQTENANGFDVARVLVSVNGGAFSAIASNAVELADPTTGWTAAVFDLSASSSSLLQIRFEFDTVDGDFNNYEGWYVDDVVVAVPDIVMLSAAANGFNSLNLAYEIKDAPVGPFDIAFYRSQDNQFDGAATDAYLDHFTIATSAELAVGVHTDSYSIGGGAFDIALPGAGAPEFDEDYYILAVADPNDSIWEFDVDPFNGGQFNEDNTVALTGAYHPPGGQVFVHGSDDVDSIHAWAAGANINVQNTNSGLNATYPAADVSALRIRAHDGFIDSIIGSDSNGGVSKPMYVLGGPGVDHIAGGALGDVLDSGPGNDHWYSYGTPAADTMTVSPDVIPEQLKLVFGTQTDIFRFDEEDRIHLHGGGGNDKLSIDAAVIVFGALLGGPGNDTLSGGGAADYLYGEEGNDILNGKRGDDHLSGGPGTDTWTLEGTEGMDFLDVDRVGGVLIANRRLTEFGPPVEIDSTLYGDIEKFTVKGLGGNDKLNSSFLDAAEYVAAGLTSLTLDGGNGDDTLEGSGGNDSLLGVAGNDTLKGNGGNDSLEGGAGNDSLLGGSGNDTYIFKVATAAELDILTELPSEGTDHLSFSTLSATTPVTVNLGSDTALATHANRTVKTAAAGQAANFENATGGKGNDTLTGTAANNNLNGGTGNDMIFALLGNDTLIGGTGNDTLNGGGGNDSLTGNAGLDTYFFEGTGGADDIDLTLLSTTQIKAERRAVGSPTLLESDTFTFDASDFINVLALALNDDINVSLAITIDGKVDGGPGTDTCVAPAIWEKVSCEG